MAETRTDAAVQSSARPQRQRRPVRYTALLSPTQSAAERGWDEAEVAAVMRRSIAAAAAAQKRKAQRTDAAARKPRPAPSPWDGSMARVRAALNKLAFAKLALQSNLAERRGWGAAAAAGDASRDDASSSAQVPVRDAVRTARLDVVRHRRALASSLRALLAHSAAGEGVEGAGGIRSFARCAVREGLVPGMSLPPRRPREPAAGEDESDGSSSEEEDDVPCGKCSGGDETDDNPILLCDHKGCGRAFHRLCVGEPPALEGLDDEDEPWVCDHCYDMAEALAIVVETETDVDEESLAGLARVLDTAADEEERVALGAGAVEAAAEDDGSAAMREAAAAAAAPADGVAPGGGRKRGRGQALSYAVLDSLMFGSPVAGKGGAAGQSDTSDEEYDEGSAVKGRAAPGSEDGSGSSSGSGSGSSSESEEDEEGPGPKRPRRGAAERAVALITEEVAAAGGGAEDSDEEDEAFGSEDEGSSSEGESEEEGDE